MFKKLIITVFALILSSCSATKVSNFNSYQKHPLLKTAFMPTTEAVKGESYKAVVFKLDENNNLVAKQSGLGKSIAVSVENILTSNNLARLVDRKAASKLQREIALAEINKTGSYKGPQIADYAVSGVISNASFTKEYISSRPYYNPQTGQLSVAPPKYNYTANVAGNIKIYELPSMAVVKTIAFNDSKSRSENIQADNSVSLGGLVQFSGTQSKGLDRDDSLVRNAADDAIQEVSHIIKNVFARTAYILEKRIFKSKTIFKITLGSKDGLKKGDEFDVIGQYEVQNSLTNQNEIEIRTIAQGRVTDQIGSNFAWVILDNKDDINNVRLGDKVKFRYKLTFLQKILLLF